MLPDWIYTADPALFEARKTVKRKSANYFSDVVGIGTPDFEDEDALEKSETLKLIKAAHEAVNAAQKVEGELVHQARSQGISLKEVGKCLGIKEAGVKNYEKRNPITPERQLEITRELRAWAALNWFWHNSEETDDLGESIFLYGVDRLLAAQHQFDQAINIGSGGGDLMAKAYSSLRSAFECFRNPQIPRVIEKHAPKIRSSEDVGSSLLPGTAVAYIRHGIINVILAKMAFDNSFKDSSDMLQSGIYMAWALTSLSRPEAMFVSDEMIEFLRREHPNSLLSESGISLEQASEIIKRKFGSGNRRWTEARSYYRNCSRSSAGSSMTCTPLRTKRMTSGIGRPAGCGGHWAR